MLTIKSMIDLLKNILVTGVFNKVLDIGWGKWFYALYCASYWAKVDIVEPNVMPWFQYKLWSHPLITHYEMMCHQFMPEAWKYDIIILWNVIQFMKMEYVSKLLPKLREHLNENGSILISFFKDRTKEEINLILWSPVMEYNKLEWDKDITYLLFK